MFNTFLTVCLVILSIVLLLLFIRTILGPSTADRILGLDAIGVTLIAFIGLIMMLRDSVVYSDIVLVISILSFVGTITLSKFLERGVVFDDN